MVEEPDVEILQEEAEETQFKENSMVCQNFDTPSPKDSKRKE